jgi:hypothetical protein
MNLSSTSSSSPSYSYNAPPPSGPQMAYAYWFYNLLFKERWYLTTNNS